MNISLSLLRKRIPIENTPNDKRMHIPDNLDSAPERSSQGLWGGRTWIAGAPPPRAGAFRAPAGLFLFLLAPILCGAAAAATNTISATDRDIARRFIRVAETAEVIDREK